jgi:hypothetical protein
MMGGADDGAPQAQDAQQQPPKKKKRGFGLGDLIGAVPH